MDKDTPTQVGRALAQLGIELIPAYSPEAVIPRRLPHNFGTIVSFDGHNPQKIYFA